MEHDGHRKRLRERFRQSGLNGFAPHEALELLLTYVIPRRDVNPLAHRLIAHFGTFSAVLEANEQELRQVDGVGEQTAALLALLLPLFRLYQNDRLGAKPVLKNRAQTAAYCVSLLDGLTQEHLYALYLDGHMRLLNAVLIAKGTLDEVAVYPRTVLAAALRCNASGVVLAHNHPSGTRAPSQEDVDLTARIASLLAGVSITLFDHIIVAKGETVSLYGEGYIITASEQEIPAAAAAQRTLRPKAREESDEGSQTP